MTDQRNVPRRPLTHAEQATLRALLKVSWDAGALDLTFLRQLARKDCISEKQSRRLFRMAMRRELDA